MLIFLPSVISKFSVAYTLSSAFEDCTVFFHHCAQKHKDLSLALDKHTQDLKDKHTSLLDTFAHTEKANMQCESSDFNSHVI